MLSAGAVAVQRNNSADQVPFSVAILDKTASREDAVADMPVDDHGNPSVVFQSERLPIRTLSKGENELWRFG